MKDNLKQPWLIWIFSLVMLVAFHGCQPTTQPLPYDPELVVVPGVDAGPDQSESTVNTETTQPIEQSAPEGALPDHRTQPDTGTQQEATQPDKVTLPEPTAEPVPEATTESASPPEPTREAPPLAQVKILQPQANDNAINPVTFQISAQHVSTVQLFSGTYALAPAWDPATTTSLTYTFTNVNTQHNIILKGYDAQDNVIATDSHTITVVPKPNQDKGTLVAKMYITYYYLSREANYSGSATATLYDSSCKALVKVIPGFSDSACIEGSGILNDGRVINYAKTCSCGRSCPTGGIVCWKILDKTVYPWGQGSQSRPLRPMRSLAVDRSIIPIGTKLYIEEWDGVQIPNVDGIGGFTHDGCVTADDVGGAIKGNHFDFFSGTSGMWKALEKIHATKKYLTVYRDPGRCP